MLNVDHLQCFVAVVEEGGFRAASERMHKAQSAVSYSIKTIETDMDIELFDRSNYHPKLTPAGEAFYRRTKRFIRHHDDLIHYASSIQTGVEGRIRLSVSVLYPMQELLRILSVVQTQFPDTDIDLSVDLMDGGRRLEREEVDLAIVTHLPNDITFYSETIASVTMPFVVSTEHELAKAPRPVPRHQVLNTPQIVLRSHENSDPTMGVLEGASVWEVTDFRTKRELILNGLGFGRLPYHDVAKDLSEHNLHLLTITGEEEASVPLLLARRSPHAQGPVSELLWQRILHH